MAFGGGIRVLWTLFLVLYTAGTMNSESGTVLVNSEANTMVESDLGTMVINESDEEDDGTMKSKLVL